jgi:ABC-type transporter Mla subunit MlaD
MAAEQTQGNTNSAEAATSASQERQPDMDALRADLDALRADLARLADRLGAQVRESVREAA